MANNLEKIDVFWDLDLEGILGGFWEGFGRPKTSIFALFSMFFRSHFASAFRRGKISAQVGPKDGEGKILELGSGVRETPGERKREGLQDLC